MSARDGLDENGLPAPGDDDDDDGYGYGEEVDE